MLKRMISLVLCMAMVFSLLPVGTFATEEAETEAAEETTAPIIEETEPAEQTQPSEAPPVTETEAVEPALLDPEPTEETAGQDEAFVVEISEMDSEELLLGYLDPMYQSGSISFFGTLARERLSGADKVAYDALKARIELLAAGKVDSTQLTISFEGTGHQAAEVDLAQVIEALIHDCPYEMYWCGGYAHVRGSDPLKVIMIPNAFYQAEGFDYRTNPYMNKDLAQKTTIAAKRISIVLAKYKTCDTYDKLAGYADEICALVTYDHDAANNNTFETNINPWTLINVFDRDSSTNVVCEGYAEAFQYLCDMTTNFDESVECYSVKGNDHKWNIVRINGVSYLMDVTHCDEGQAAKRGPKFLGGGLGSVSGGYIIGGFDYWYEADILTLWGTGDDSILKLSSTKYTPPVKYTVAYDANGGTGAPGSQSQKEGSSLTLSSTVPIRAGHEFLGWALSADAQDAQYQPGDTYSADSNVMFYAVWKDISCGPDLIWEFDGENGVLTISGTGAMNAVPSAEYTPWYVHRNEIKTVVVEEGVTALGECAFAECGNLEEVQLPQTLTAIGSDAFYNCGSLGSISLPAGLTTIGHSAFYNCSSLQSVFLPEGVQSLEENTFGWCLKLAYVALPSGLAEVDKNVFYLCSALNHVFYGGTAAQREQLSIASTGNSTFKNAVWHCDADGTEVEARNDCEGSGLACTFCGEFIVKESNGTGEHSYENDLDLSCDVCGHVRSVQAISLAAVPAQAKYDIFTGTLDVSGGRVQLTYSDGSIVTVDLNEEMVTGFDNTVLGTQHVAVTWGGCNTGFDVEILPGTPDSLDIISPAKKSLYALEDALDLSGLQLSASYEGYGAVDVPLTYAEVSPVDMITPGEKTVTLTVGGVSASYPILVQSMCLVPVETANYPESKHDYDANTDETQILTVPGAYRLTVTFSHETATEAGADFLYVYDGEDHQVAVYSGTQASGKSVVVSGDTVKFRLTSNGSGNAYGYSISTVEATMTAHVFGDWEVTSDATCVDAGLRSRTCLGRNCSYTETETIPATGEHSYTDGICIHCGAFEDPEAHVENRVVLNDAAFDGLDMVWIDGVEMDIQAEDGLRYVDLSNADARVMTAYEFDVEGTADDGVETHARYPVGMKVWTLENLNGYYSAIRQTEFDNILQYVGCSVRVTGKNGIRMITAMEEGKKKSLTGAGLAGYTLKEYGTAIAWASQVSMEKPLLLGQPHVRSNYAYKKDVADPVFRYWEGMMQYTNVLVNFSMEQCKKDIAMRPYMILTDGEEEIVLYGGIVERSIGYVACQNRNTFKSDMDAYEYIWDIIHAVYGDRFDADYAPEWTSSEK